MGVEDPWDVFVTDTFDLVGAVSIREDGWALDGFTAAVDWGVELDFLDVGVGLLVWISKLEIVGSGDGTGGTSGEERTEESLLALGEVQENFFEGATSAVVVPCVVLEEFELVEVDDLVTTFSAELLGLVENFLDVGFAAWGGVDLSVVSSQPGETFFRHVLWENSDVLATEEAGVEGTTTAEVTGGWEHTLLLLWVESTLGEHIRKHDISGTDLVGTSWEILA